MSDENAWDPPQQSESATLRKKVVQESTLPTPADVCAAQRAQLLADLRAKVETLPGSPMSALDWVLRVDVLALIDGGSDE